MKHIRWDRFQVKKFLTWFESSFFAGTPVYSTLLFITGGTVADQIQVADDHADIHATVSFVDAEGNPTTAENPVTWDSDNTAAVEVLADADGLGATVHFGAPGAAIVSAVTTNAAGAEVRAQGTVTVVPGDVALGTVDFGDV